MWLVIDTLELSGTVGFAGGQFRVSRDRQTGLSGIARGASQFSSDIEHLQLNQHTARPTASARTNL
jgi:hypothetical protein